MAEVILKNICKVYEKENFVVKNISLEVKDKEFVVLVGPSGCGKSTTLRMIAGLEEISSGELFIDNKKVNDVSPKDRDIAMVFQNYALYPHMSVFENMAFGLKLRKFSKDEIKKRVDEAAKILGLENYLNRKPKALSGGQRQRVAVGRAIVRKPKVFLFDEPLSNLDAKLRVQMRTEISKLHQRLEATMVYVTHDQTEAMTMGDKIVVMKNGEIQQIDTPLCLYNYPVNKFVAGFIGSPSMNFVLGKIIQDNGLIFVTDDNELRIKLNSIQYELLKNSIEKKLWLGIRPEDIYENKSSVDNKEHYNVQVNLDVVEPLGNETYLYFNIAKTDFTARISTREMLNPNSSINISFNTSKLHFFDYEDETRLINQR